MIPGTIVDTSALWHVVVGALVAGVAVTIAFSLAVLGATRSAEMRSDGRQTEAVAFGVLALLGLAAFAAAVIVSIVVMTSK